MTNILETAMLVCFGLSWPINLIKNIKAKTAKAVSLKFLLLIILGYLCGIGAKFVSHQYNYVLAVYFLNLAIVTANLVVYFINRKHDAQTGGVTIEPKSPSKNAEKVIDVNDKCYIEIHKINGAFNYRIMALDKEEYKGNTTDRTRYFWTPIDENISFFDTEEKAISAAIEEAKQKNQQ